MTTLCHSHIKRKWSRRLHKTPAGKIALFALTIAPQLKPYLGVIEQYLQCMEKSIKCEGLQAVSRYKAYKHQLLRFIDERKFPKRGKFRHLVPLLRIIERTDYDHSVIVALHTVCRYYDHFEAPQKVVDVKKGEFIETFISDTPQQKSTYPRPNEGVRGYLVSLWDDTISRIWESDNDLTKAFQKGLPLHPQLEAIFLFKKGVTKVKGYRVKGDSQYAPSIIGAPDEAARLEAMEVDSSNFMTSDWVEFSNGWDFINQAMNLLGKFCFPSVHSVQFEIVGVPSSKDPLVRLNAIRDNGYKVRIVRPVSYWLQYLLQPIHDSLMAILRHLPSDYTRDHAEGFKNLQSHTQRDCPFASYDMSSATDRLPAGWQWFILRGIYRNSIIPSVWWDALTQFPNEEGFEKMGTPMGALASWSAMALTNHANVWIAANLAGLLDQLIQDPSDFYAIVGDDCVIYNHSIALKYREIMQALGVPINDSKSFVQSSVTKVSEFVKRNSRLGKEISAISPNLIIKSFKDWGVATTLVSRVYEIFTYSEDLRDRCIELYTIFGSSYTRSVVEHLGNLPQMFCGFNSNDAIDTMPPLLVQALALAKLKTIVKWSSGKTKVNHSGKNVTDQFDDWCQATVSGLKPSDQPLVVYNRMKAKEEKPLVTELQILARNSEIADFLKDIHSSQEIIKFLEAQQSFKDIFTALPFFELKEKEQKFQYSYSLRIKKFLSRKDKHNLSEFVESEVWRILKELKLDEYPQLSAYESLFAQMTDDEFNSVFSEEDTSLPEDNDPPECVSNDTESKPKWLRDEL